MAETGGTGAILEIENDIVAGSWSNAHGNGVKLQRVAGLPSDDMICASSVSAHAKPDDQDAFFVVQRQATSENDHSAYRFSHHGIIRLPKELRVTRESDIWIGRSDDSE
jgi:hypothetical protein